MAGWMDQLMAAGWMPPGAGAPAMPPVEGSEFVDPDIDPRTGKKKTPFPEVKPPVQQWGPMAGILEPGIGQMNSAGLEPGRAYMKDPMMPGNDPSPFMQPAERKMQAIVDPGIEQTAERVPMPMGRPPEADAGNAAAAGGAGATPLGSAAPKMVREADGSQLPATDVSSSNRGQTNTAAPEEPTGFGSLVPKIGDFLKNNSNTLLALGAGFAGAPNIGQGISRAAAAAIPASARDISQRTQLQTQSSTYRALVEAGVPKQQAIAAVGNPEMAKALIAQYVTGNKYEVKTVKTKNAWGEETEQLVAIDPRDPTKSAINISTGQAMGGAGGAAAAPGGGGVNAPPASSFYAKGITDANYDATKSGDEYLAQFSPEVQQAAKDYIAGRTAQTGRQLPQQRIKMIAQKYGTDIGMPADDTAIGQRKVFANSLADTKNGIGGQVKGFQQGLEHMAKLSERLVKLNNANLWLEPLSKGYNAVKNLTTENKGLANGVEADSTALAGEIGKLFSGNAGGGVHERREAAERLGNVMSSSEAAAGAVEATMELMHGGLRPLERRRDELFPNGNAPRGSEFVSKREHDLIATINKNLEILRGKAKAGEAAAPHGNAAAPRAPGRYRYDDTTGAFTPVQ